MTDSDTDLILWYLLFTGYLTTASEINQQGSKLTTSLRTPNQEIASTFVEKM